MKKPSRRKTSLAKSVGVRPDHPLVGTWEDPSPMIWIPVHYNHPLIGTWQEVENSVDVSSVIYKIAAVDGRFVVTGIDEHDGAKLKISEVRWDGKELQFTSIYPLTGYRTEHLLRPRRPGLINHWVTYTQLEVWRKRPEKRSRKRAS